MPDNPIEYRPGIDKPGLAQAREQIKAVRPQAEHDAPAASTGGQSAEAIWLAEAQIVECSDEE